MTELPRGWATATLGEVAAWSSGGTPRAGTATYYGGDIPWAVIGDLNDGRVSLTASTITPLGLRNSSAKIVDKGTVLVAMYGSIGKLGISQIPMATNQAIACAVPSRAITRDWLFWWLRSQRHELLAAGKGGTQSNISQTVLKAWPIPIAPRSEQERIVTAIEEAFSKLDAGEAGLRTVRQLLKRMREAILTAAVTGRLVSQDPTDTPAAKLLGVEAAEPDGVPELPPSWAWTELGVIAEVVGGVTKDSKRQSDASFVEVPYLRVANVQRGFLDLETITTIRVAPEKAAQLELQRGDVLFNEGGDRDKLGRGWVWEGQIASCIHQNHVFRARLSGGVEPKLVSIWGNTFGRGWFEDRGKQTTNLASLNLKTLKAFPVPIAPVEEQSRILAEVERQMSFLDACERAVDVGVDRAAGLRRSVLKAAFEGRLVPQDPSDEPATVLLERIRAERSVQSVTKRRARQSA